MSNYERFIDKLFDENNEETVKLKDVDGREIEFEQIALVDYEEKYYAILCPITPVEGVGEDEFMVFLVDEEKDELTYVEDEEITSAIEELLNEEEQD